MVGLKMLEYLKKVEVEITYDQNIMYEILKQLIKKSSKLKIATKISTMKHPSK